MEKELRTIRMVPYVSRTNIRCQDCNISQICIPYTLNADELHQLDKIIERKTPFQKGHLLFKAGDQFTALYAIRSGTIKSYVTQQGKTQINAFYSAGDLVGFDAIDSLQHPSSAQALDTSMVCEIPFESLNDLSSQIPTLRRQLLRLMSHQIKQDQARIFSLSKKNAKERLALFIYMFTQKMAQRGLSSKVFRLSMSRADISNYLGLTVETISRLFSLFQHNGILTAKGKYITIHNNKMLLQLIKPTE